MRLSVFTAVISALVLVRVDAARADQAEDAKAAKELFDQGVALMNARRDVEACPFLRASLERFPGNGTRGKLAECYEKVGRVASAWTTYREVARVAGEANDVNRQRVAEARAQALAPRLSYLAITPPTPSPDGLVIVVDGVETKPAAFGEPTPRDAGLATVEARAAGHRPFRASVRVTSGEVTRFDVPALEPLRRADEGRLLVVAAPQDSEPQARPGGGTWRMPVALGLGGAGVLSLGVGTVLALSAKGIYDDAFDTGRCDRAMGTCDAAGKDDTDGSRSRAAAATVFFVAGAALAAGGAVVYLTTPKAKRTFGFTPVVHHAGGGAIVTLSL